MLEAVAMTEKKKVLQVQRLSQARDQMGLSQAEIARRLGILPEHYNRIEHGKHQPSLGLMVDIARILDISIDYLLGATDQPEGLPAKVLTPEQEALQRIERAEYEIEAARKAIKQSIASKRDRS